MSEGWTSFPGIVKCLPACHSALNQSSLQDLEKKLARIEDTLEIIKTHIFTNAPAHSHVQTQITTESPLNSAAAPFAENSVAQADWSDVVEADSKPTILNHENVTLIKEKDHSDEYDNQESASDVVNHPAVSEEHLAEKRRQFSVWNLVQGIEHYKIQNYRKAVQHFHNSLLGPVEKDEETLVWNNLGFCYALLGEFKDALASFRKALNLDRHSKQAWVNLGGALKEIVFLQESIDALEEGIAIGSSDKTSITGFITLTQLRIQMGDHNGALTVIERALAGNPNKDASMLEFYYLRATCLHALGNLIDASLEYQSVIKRNDSNLSEDDKDSKLMSMYQMAVSTITYNTQDWAVEGFTLDDVLPTLVKEHWSRRQPPTEKLLGVYSPVLKHSSPSRPQGANPRQVRDVLNVADYVGSLVHNHHAGFIPNLRLQRAAGLGALEMAQMVRGVVLARKQGKKFKVLSSGATGHRDSENRYEEAGWRDAMDLVVKWRQVGEPKDQVLWIDMMTRERFEEGFASDTKTYYGQTKHVRYYSNFERILTNWKRVISETGKVVLIDTKEPFDIVSQEVFDSVEKANTPDSMWRSLGFGHGAMISIKSKMREGHRMNGTYMCVRSVATQTDGFDLSIHTPVTPPRWEDFEQEFEMIWDRLITAMAEENMAETSRWISTFGYYWFNFMPLVRGTALTGYTAILGLFWAANMPVRTELPENYCPDWDAILEEDPDVFTESLLEKIAPPEAQQNREKEIKKVRILGRQSEHKALISQDR
ncbi:hypothetical protein BSKO_04321 [Bryopsis sp. KO-2023]|nr:hypothetical protein BSKO_04321 [Bryopsis sp. KO-2023]